MAAAAAGGFAPPAVAAARAVLIVERDGNEVMKVPLDCSKVACDPGYSNYPNQPSGPTAVPPGYTASTIVALAGAGSTDNVWKMDINGGAQVLPGDSLDSASYYPPGQFSPFFYTNGAGPAIFRRPPTSATDLNARDTVTDPDGKMTVNVQTINPLTVTATVDPPRGQVKHSLSFSVTVPVSELRSGESLKAIWTFSNGISLPAKALGASGSDYSAASSYSFDAVGTYSATVNVQGSLGSEGSYTLRDIPVGKKPAPSGPGTKKPNKNKRPVSGSPHKTKTHPNPGSGSGTTGSTQPTIQSPPSSQSTPASSQPAPSVVTKKPLPKVPSIPGVSVSGVLLSAPVTEVAKAPSPSAAQGPGGTTVDGPGGGIPGAVGGIGLAVLLLVGGFLSEGLSAVRWR